MARPAPITLTCVSLSKPLLAINFTRKNVLIIVTVNHNNLFSLLSFGVAIHPRDRITKRVDISQLHRIYIRMKCGFIYSTFTHAVKTCAIYISEVPYLSHSERYPTSEISTMTGPQTTCMLLCAMYFML